MLKVHPLWADPAVSSHASVFCAGAGPTPELAGHSPARGQAVSSRGQGGSVVRGKRSLVCEAFCLRRQLLPASSREGSHAALSCSWRRGRADGPAGPDSSQIAWEVWVECRGGARSKIWRGGEQEPPLAISLVFCLLGNRDVLQGLSVVFNLPLLELPGERLLLSGRMV